MFVPLPHLRNVCTQATLLLAAATSTHAHTPGAVCRQWSEWGCNPTPPISVWPQPQHLSVGTGPAVGVSPRLNITCPPSAAAHTPRCDDVLVAAMDRYSAIIQGE